MDSREEVYCHGFPDFNKDDNTGFNLTDIDIRSLIKGDIISLSVGIKCIVIATKQGNIIRKLLNENEGFEVIELFEKEESKEGFNKHEEVLKTFMDPYGYHCIIVTNNDNVFYLHFKSKNIIPLGVLKGFTITAIGFALDATSDSTKSMLIGTSLGQLVTYEIKDADTDEIIEESYKVVLQLPGNFAVCGIVFDTYQRRLKEKDSIGYATFVMVFTVESCYQFTGSMPFSELFRQSKLSGEINKHRRPMYYEKLKESEVKIFYKFNENEVLELSSFAWKTEIAVCYGRFRPKEAFEGRVTITDFTTDAYQKKDMTYGQMVEVPEAIGATDLYVLFLYNDSVVVISKIAKQIEYIESFRSESRMVQMAYELSTKSMLICSNRRLYRLTIANEDKNLWRQELERSNFAEALRLCKENDGKYYSYVAGAYADSKFKGENFLEAAELYAISSRTFEDVVVKFLLANNTEGLEKYLTLKLNNIVQEDELKMQQVLLSVWLLILKLEKLKKATAIIDDVQSIDAIKSPKKRVTHTELFNTHKVLLDLGNYLDNSKDCFETDTIFQLLENYGRDKECIKLAIEKSKVETVLIHYINDGEVETALEYLRKAKDEEKNSLMIKYASAFVKCNVELTLDYLKNYFPNIQIEALVPALMNVDREKRSCVNDFLRMNMEETNNQILSNLYVFFLAENLNEESHAELLNFVNQQRLLKKLNQPLHIDKDFALNVCKYFKQTEAQIRVYGILEFYEEAVKLALDNDLIDLAKEYASLPSDSKIRKRLWINILKSIINTQEQTNSILDIIKESDKNLTLSDVFPYIPPNVKIGDFSKVLLMHLKDHGSKISELNREIKDYNKSSNDLVTGHKAFQSNLLEFSSDKCCDYCEKPLVKDPKYYIFPCLHGFHMRCLLKEQFAQKHYVIESRKAKQKNLEKSIKDIEDLLVRIGFPSEIAQGVDVIGHAEKLLKEGGVVLATTKKRIELTPDVYRSLEIHNKRLEELLVGECLMCGGLAIETVDVPFDSFDELYWAL